MLLYLKVVKKSDNMDENLQNRKTSESVNKTQKKKTHAKERWEGEIEKSTAAFCPILCTFIMWAMNQRSLFMDMYGGEGEEVEEWFIMNEGGGSCEWRIFHGLKVDTEPGWRLERMKHKYYILGTLSSR